MLTAQQKKSKIVKKARDRIVYRQHALVLLCPGCVREYFQGSKRVR
jgi:uncharacterized protein with PIN domain